MNCKVFDPPVPPIPFDFREASRAFEHDILHVHAGCGRGDVLV